MLAESLPSTPIRGAESSNPSDLDFVIPAKSLPST
jgi:hypothetical protein